MGADYSGTCGLQPGIVIRKWGYSAVLGCNGMGVKLSFAAVRDLRGVIGVVEGRFSHIKQGLEALIDLRFEV